MRKIIVIGECCLNVIFRDDRPWRSMPGGVLLNAAASLGDNKLDASFVSEAANDHVGDIIVNFLDGHNVTTRSIDRYTDGATPSTLVFTSDHGEIIHKVRYTRYPEQSFDTIWPTIGPDDIVIFGESYSLDTRVRSRLFDIVRYAAERHAIIIYAPAIDGQRISRITRVMPEILENLEIADIIITDTANLSTIFNKTDDAAAYNDHISFYSYTHLNLNPVSGEIALRHRKNMVTANARMDNGSQCCMSAIIAGVAAAIVNSGIMHGNIENLDDTMLNAIVRSAETWSDAAAQSIDNLAHLNIP